jgi:CheY-like chemotaxis protein
MERLGGVRVSNSVLLILVVEDDLLIQEMIQEALAEGGFEN